jgi:hypothetical protein
MFCIRVRFKNLQGSWSKTYTYKSEERVEVGNIVVVPTGTFLGVGKVIGCDDDFEDHKDFKFIVQLVDTTHYHELVNRYLEKSSES